MLPRRPAIHFISAGALLFLFAGWIGPTAPGDGARPRAPGVLDEDELLYRAALARGLDRDDPVVQERLLRNMRFLGGAADPAALYRDALALGLADSDLVVRRRLIDCMRRALQEPALAGEPSDAELQAYLDAHAARFATPARVWLSQVFLSRARRGAALEADAQRLLGRLGPADVARASALGDALALPSELRSASAQDLARLFGPRFAPAALALEPGRWQGPLASPYGVHLVWVHERTPAALPALASVRAEVRGAWRDDRAAAALRDAVRALRDQYAAGDGHPPG